MYSLRFEHHPQSGEYTLHLAGAHLTKEIWAPPHVRTVRNDDLTYLAILAEEHLLCNRNRVDRRTVHKLIDNAVTEAQHAANGHPLDHGPSITMDRLESICGLNRDYILIAMRFTGFAVCADTTTISKDRASAWARLDYARSVNLPTILADIAAA